MPRRAIQFFLQNHSHTNIINITRPRLTCIMYTKSSIYVVDAFPENTMLARRNLLRRPKIDVVAKQLALNRICSIEF